MEEKAAVLENETERKKDEDILYNQLSSDREDQYVTFNLDNEEFGVPILSVQEIISIPAVTKVPNAPPFIRGLINLRGNVLSLIDLRKKLEFPEKDLDKYSVVLVIKLEQGAIGMIVDAVSDVVSFTSENLQTAPEFSSSVNTQFISKIGKLNERLFILLNIDKLLSQKELHAISQVGT